MLCSEEQRMAYGFEFDAPYECYRVFLPLKLLHVLGKMFGQESSTTLPKAVMLRPQCQHMVLAQLRYITRSRLEQAA